MHIYAHTQAQAHIHGHTHSQMQTHLGSEWLVSCSLDSNEPSWIRLLFASQATRRIPGSLPTLPKSESPPSFLFYSLSVTTGESLQIVPRHLISSVALMGSHTTMNAISAWPVCKCPCLAWDAHKSAHLRGTQIWKQQDLTGLFLHTPRRLWTLTSNRISLSVNSRKE